MRKKIVFLVAISMLMVNTVFALGFKSNNMTKTIAGVDVPVWEVGDYWKYDLDLSGSQESYLEFEISIDDLTFTVEQVLSDKYKVHVSATPGNLQGSGTVQLSFIQISGSLVNGELDGYLYVNKTDIGIVNQEGFLPDVTIEGTLKSRAVSADLEIELTSIFSSLMFPLDVGNEWIIAYNIFTIHYDVEYGLLNFNDRSSEDDAIYPMWLVVNEHEMICSKIDLVTVPFGSYKDSYEIQWKNDPNQVIWYSPDAKNIVKVDLSNINLLILFERFTMELVESNYEPPNDPPETPDIPNGETNGYQYVEYTYETSAEDPNLHDVQYGFDWGDGSDITWTSLVSSGSTAEASHTYTTAGSYEIKVKAKDEKGSESSLSEPLTVIINSNSKPIKPDKPDGPSQGSEDTSYTYKSKTSDSDGDQVFYLFDWGDYQDSGWLGPYDSNVEVSADHSWRNQGDYNIKVRAKDEHGAFSDWSDPLSVSMPKYKINFNLFLKNYPLLERLFSKLFNF